MEGIIGKATLASIAGVVGVVAWDGSDVAKFPVMSSPKARVRGSGIFCFWAGPLTGVFFTLIDVLRVPPRRLKWNGVPCR